MIASPLPWEGKLTINLLVLMLVLEEAMFFAVVQTEYSLFAECGAMLSCGRCDACIPRFYGSSRRRDKVTFSVSTETTTCTMVFTTQLRSRKIEDYV
eukprot:scaffold69_cov198-Alexandrium_tamarense.AAC.97